VDLATVEDEVMFVRGFVNPNRAKRKLFELHDDLRRGEKCKLRLASRAFLRGDGVECGPALLDFFAAAMRALIFFASVLCNGQDLRKGFLAGLAKEFVVGHNTSHRDE